MSYNIEILTEGTFTKDMYCRPLEASFIGQSDTFMTESTYAGSPINNFKWTPITEVLGECWMGTTIEEYEAKLETLVHRHVPYEWCRGNLPPSHILK